jgi:hypothetical protein
MDIKGIIIIPVLLLISSVLSAQDTSAITPANENTNTKAIYGFIRGGLYGGLTDIGNKPYISSGYSDLGLKIESSDGIKYKAFADLRFRYGTEFQKPVSTVEIREAFVKLISKRWDISAGQKIIKWGRTDIFNPLSKLNPRNLVSRSPDREDIDIGNLNSTVTWYPSQYITLQAVAVPFYRSSVLLIDPIPLPDNVTINQIRSLVTDREMFSYGLKADFHLKGIDGSMLWFDGYDPMPGIAMTRFSLDLSGPIPATATELTVKPYKTRVLGLDFETTAGAYVIRGEAAYSSPYLKYKVNEYVPMQEINWVAGIEWLPGLWRITAEYSGKTIPGFSQPLADPILGRESDYSKLAELLTIPGFDLEDYVRQQVGAFNRLYNYQMKRNNHSLGVRVETEISYGKVFPSVFTMYNLTSHDLVIIPEIKYKPSDGLTIIAGAEFYSGEYGSLYDIVNNFMNSIYIAMKVDF